MTEIDRMNEVNKICSEMMRNAQNMERAAAAESNSRQVLGKFFNAGKQGGLRQGVATVLICPGCFALTAVNGFISAIWAYIYLALCQPQIVGMPFFPLGSLPYEASSCHAVHSCKIGGLALTV